MTTIQFCNFCGWQRPVAHEYNKGRRSLYVCTDCEKKQGGEKDDILKAIATFMGTIVARKVPKEEATITDVVEKTLYQAQSPPPNEGVQRAIAETRALIRMFLLGAFLGAVGGGAFVALLFRLGFMLSG